MHDNILFSYYLTYQSSTPCFETPIKNANLAYIRAATISQILLYFHIHILPGKYKLITTCNDLSDKWLEPRLPLLELRKTWALYLTTLIMKEIIKRIEPVVSGHDLRITANYSLSVLPLDRFNLFLSVIIAVTALFGCSDAIYANWLMTVSQLSSSFEQQ
uniref:Uncharacterized protein n=1 Tax=Glossina palpalis gambiensis TaxID=67801 RepID=A0A1B0BBG3_9MUSC